jgi:hypothetical protein
MANEQRELFEILIGAVMAQSAVCEFLVKSGAVERAALIEHLAERRVSLEKTATQSALFPIDVLSALLAGRKPPPPPSAFH